MSVRGGGEDGSGVDKSRCAYEVGVGVRADKSKCRYELGVGIGVDMSRSCLELVRTNSASG